MTDQEEGVQAQDAKQYRLIAFGRDEGNEWGEKWEYDYLEVPAELDMDEVMKKWGVGGLGGLAEYLIRHKGAREPVADYYYP
jgi:hypothetical protein